VCVCVCVWLSSRARVRVYTCARVRIPLDTGVSYMIRSLLKKWGSFSTEIVYHATQSVLLLEKMVFDTKSS